MRQVLLFLSIVFLTGCSCNAGKNRTNVELIQDMMKQENIKAQEGSKEDGTLMRVPPENTRARNRSYYPYKNDPMGADKNLKNPYAGDFSAIVMGLGKRQYDKACIYCHGVTGTGDGPVGKKMIVRPPSLLVKKAISYSDGRLYHIIHEGQGLMGSYSKQVPDEQALWALVNYIRMLQKKATQNAK